MVHSVSAWKLYDDVNRNLNLMVILSINNLKMTTRECAIAETQ